MNSTFEQVTLIAPDISCGHCVATVKETAGALAGVNRVEADATTKRIDVEFDPIRLSLAEIETALAAAGYPVQNEHKKRSSLDD